MEQRIDDILEQIQGIISGLEDTTFSRFEKIESELADVGVKIDAIKRDGLAEAAHSLARRGIDSLDRLQVKI